MKKGLEFRIERTLDQHVLVFSLLVLFLAGLWVSDGFAVGNSCHALNPNIDCSVKGVITRDQVLNNKCWIDVSEISINGMDNFRELPSCGDGFKHAEFIKNSYTGTFHYDTYNALSFPFGTIDHLADFMSLSSGIDDTVVLILLWAIIFFGTYYTVRESQKISKKMNI